MCSSDLATLAVWLGLGVNRQLPPWQVTLVALLLTALPGVGIWALLGQGPAARVAAMWLWPAVCFTLLPGFFPGEFSSAFGTGLATLATIGGTEWVEKAGVFGENFEPLPVATGKAPPPVAKPLTPDCPPVSDRDGDEVALPYEIGRAHV